MPASSGPGGRRDDSRQLAFVGIVQPDFEQEAIELRLGQRIGALHLDRIQRRHHEVRRLEAVGRARHRHLQLGHRLEQRGLRLRRRAIDFVAEQDMAERRSRLKGELATPVLARQNHARAGDIGRHQIDGELNSVEAQIEREPQRLDQRGFAGAGDAFDQHVAAREQRRQQFLDRLLVADDHLVNLGLDAPKRPGEIRHRRRFRLYVTHRSNTRLIVVRSSAGTAARATGSSGSWFRLSGVRTLGGT